MEEEGRTYVNKQDDPDEERQGRKVGVLEAGGFTVQVTRSDCAGVGADSEGQLSDEGARRMRLDCRVKSWTTEAKACEDGLCVCMYVCVCVCQCLCL